VEDLSYQGFVIGGAAQPGQFRTYPDYKVIIETKYKSVLPEDQKAVVEMVKAAALKYGFELKVVDVTEEGFLQKLEGRSKGINTFPAFVTDSGLKIEGDISEERIKALLKEPTHGGRQMTKNRLVRCACKRDQDQYLRIGMR